MKYRVYYFNRIINFAINISIYIIPAVLGVLSICNFGFIKEKVSTLLNKSFGDLELGVLLFLLELLITTIITILSKNIKKYISLSSYIKHKLYSWLRVSFINSKHKTSRILGNKSINVFFYINYKPTKDQKKIEKRILEIAHSNYSEKTVFWIQGDTFSGKTTTITHLLLCLISQNSNYRVFKEVDNKFTYVDFLYDNFRTFLKKYENHRFEKNLLIIDNVYMLSEADLHRLINVISNGILAKLIIVSMREFHEITNDAYRIGMLNRKISLVGEQYHISQLKYDSSYFAKNAIPVDFEPSSFHKMDICLQIHYLNMFENNNNIQILSDIFDYLNGRISQNNFSHLVIFVISCLCVFTGSFSNKQLMKCLLLRKKRRLLGFVLSELHSCGFIDRTPYGFGETYILNSKIAKYYFRLGYNSKAFNAKSCSIIEHQYNYYKNIDSHLAFLYGCFLKNNISDQKEIFDLLAINTNFSVLLGEMEFLVSVDKKIETIYRREIGILCDRTGNLIKSRCNFKTLLNKAQKNNNLNLSLEIFYRLVQIDHTEYENYKQLRNCYHSVPYLKIQKRYWQLHIDMHKGKFSFEDFIQLLKQTNVICDKVCYDNLHLARRIYFDAYRMYYLDGTNNSDYLFMIKKVGSNIEQYLHRNLDEFSLYLKKFETLFLLSKDILYNLVVHNSTIDIDVYNSFVKSTGIEYENMSNRKAILNLCINLCKELEDGFDKIGDKTANFIRYYRTELLIIQNDPSCISLINMYRNFGKDEIEYRLYAEFIELKYQISQLISIELISTYSNIDYECLKSKIYTQLEVIHEFFRGPYINEYAVMRYKIYELFISIIDTKSVPYTMIESALKLAKRNKYNREFKLLNKIKEFNGHISFGWCRDVLLYYPIVPQ